MAPTRYPSGAAGSSNPGPSWQVKGSGDFNGDGKADILWQNSDGTAAIWLMNGTNVLTVRRRRLQSGAELARSRRSGDFNGDGKADILWQNNDGTPAIWLMDGIDRLIGRCRRLVQSGAELADQGQRRLQRRRQVRHPVAERRRHAGDLADGRHQRAVHQRGRLVQPWIGLGIDRLT